MADSTSAAREAAKSKYPVWTYDDYVCKEPVPLRRVHEREQKAYREGHEAGASWQRSQPRVVSEAAVEAIVESVFSYAFHGNVSSEAQAKILRYGLGLRVRIALERAYAVEEQP